MIENDSFLAHLEKFDKFVDQLDPLPPLIHIAVCAGLPSASMLLAKKVREFPPIAIHKNIFVEPLSQDTPDIVIRGTTRFAALVDKNCSLLPSTMGVTPAFNNEDKLTSLLNSLLTAAWVVNVKARDLIFYI